MDYANQRYFDDPASRVAAMGGDVRYSPHPRKSEFVAPDGKVIFRLTNGGISKPVKTVLPAWSLIVRIGRGPLPQEVAPGAWWMLWNDYKKIEKFADANGYSVPVAIRLLCCVLLDWNEMSLILQARLKIPLLAFSGPSAPAMERNPNLKTSEYLDAAKAKELGVRQLYIPGMTDPDLRHDALLIGGYGHLPPEQSRNGYVIRPYS